MITLSPEIKDNSGADRSWVLTSSSSTWLPGELGLIVGDSREQQFEAES